MTRSSPHSPVLPSTSLEIYLSRRPSGLLSPTSDFGTRRTPLPRSLPRSTVLVRVLYVSADPAMRGWMTAAKSYVAPVEIGAVMRAAGVGEVVRVAEEGLEGFAVGDIVSGMVGWCEFGVFEGRALEKVEVPRGLSVSHAIGVLGGTGMTAWFGLFDIGQPKKGDVVVVSAAAGATGSVVAQLAKHIVGCTVIGIAGGKKKCDYLLDTLGLDAAVDYKSSGGIDAGLKSALAGRTIDVYFDNVGGATLEAALRRLSIGARIVMCGAIGSYNAEAPAAGPRNIMQLVTRRARMEGLIVFDYRKRFAGARRKLGEMVVEGKVVAREDVVVGLRQAPVALLGLFEGRNTGKVVVKVADSLFGTGEEGARGVLMQRGKL